MAEFRMPSLGADMDAGTLVAWHVAKGARVRRGDVVALVETQKGIIEVEIWEGGVIDEILVQPGATVQVGTVLATVRGDAGAVATPSPAPPPALRPATAPDLGARTSNGSNGSKGSKGAPAAVSAVSAMSTVSAPPERARVRASPAARQLAREHAIDLTTLRGTGPHEAVTRTDVARAIAVTPATTSTAHAEGPESRARGSDSVANMRKAIAAAMGRSKREIPHYYLSADLDVSRGARWLEATNAGRPVTERILFAALLLKATALALRQVPELNGVYVGDAFRPAENVNIGVAIALRQGGLVAPALHDTDRKSLPEIMRGLGDLVARARTGALRSSEVSDPTITLTNLGDQGTDAVFGVIYPPQVAIVGFGRVRDRPWADGGMLGVRPVVTASLAADHRVSDGHRGARFLAVLGHLLTEPDKL